jgi:ribosome-binding ATPase YchF (GTP1/OBG family)
METIETELIYADLEQAERRHARWCARPAAATAPLKAEEAWLARVVEALQAGRPVRTVPVPDDAPDAQRNLSPLTGKPVLFVANVERRR